MAFFRNRVTLLLHRSTTYPRLLKTLLLICYVLGLCLFFGIFVSPARRSPGEAGVNRAPRHGGWKRGRTAPVATPAPPAKSRTTAGRGRAVSKHERYRRAVERASGEPDARLGQRKTRAIKQAAAHAVDEFEHARVVRSDQVEKLRLPLADN